MIDGIQRYCGFQERTQPRRTPWPGEPALFKHHRPHSTVGHRASRLGLQPIYFLLACCLGVGNLVDPIARLVIPLPLEPFRHKARQVLHNVPLNGPDKLQVIHDIHVVVEAGINDPAQPALHPLHPLQEQHLTLPSLNLLHQPRHPLTHMRMIPRNPTYPI